MFIDQKQRRIWPWALLVLLVLVGVGVWMVYTGLRTLTVEKIVASDTIKKYAGEENNEVVALMPRLLGFTEPQTYLFLFQNNTEMRPSGGFIGAYAAVHLDKGKMDMLAVEGSEELDRRTPPEWKPVPPLPLTEHLGVSKWYFRDANWSPDFSESAKKVRELYAAETGVAAADIDGVIAVTPTVVEALLRITGPITIQDITFTAENVTEKLEYEVEYGYRDRDIPFETRKQILKPFMTELLHKVRLHAFFDLNDFIAEMKKMADEKQIVLSVDTKDVQKKIDEFGWSGKVKEFDGDYLQWVDANLAALKTDHAMKRSLAYELRPDGKGKYVAVATMTYVNTGSFDWRTSRYRTYARVYVPQGAQLVSVEGSMLKDKSSEAGRVDQGVELNKTWFGTFISIEPGQTKTLRFTYVLPDALTTKIAQKDYQLFIQKQAGTIAHGLTLRLNFGTSIRGANPPEAEKYWGDAEYRVDTDLRMDRRFGVEIE